MRKYYVGLDVHKLSIAIALLDAYGKLVTRTVIETTTEAVRDFFRNLRGEIHLTFEEGNHAAWLYDIVDHWSDEWWPVTQSRTGSRGAATIEWTQ